MPLRHVLLALLVPVLWGVGFTLAKPAVAHFPPFLMMTAVYAITAACLAGSLSGIQTRWWALALLAALGGSVQAGLIFTGLRGLPASTAVLVLQSQVPFAVIAAWLLGDERLDLRRVLGIAVALAGVAVIAGAPQSPGSLWPLLLVILGALVWAVGQALIRVLARDEGSALAGGMALNAAPQMLLASLLFERGQLEAIRTATATDWITLLVFALGGFALAYSLWYGLLRRYRVDQVTPFALLMPVTGVAASAAFLGEAVVAHDILGGAVILAGLGIVVIPGGRPAATLAGKPAAGE